MARESTAPPTAPKTARPTLVTKVTILWKENKYLRWAASIAFISLFLNFLVGFLDKPVPAGVEHQVNSLCGGPLKTVQPWQIRAFRPKWLGLFGDPAPLHYYTKGKKAHQIAVVDIDRRDVEIRIQVDGEDRGYRPVQIDHAVYCGTEVGKCIESGFASGIVVAPAGRHKVTAEIVQKANESFEWGSERKRRVMWMVQECPQ